MKKSKEQHKLIRKSRVFQRAAQAISQVRNKKTSNQYVSPKKRNLCIKIFTEE